MASMIRNYNFVISECIDKNIVDIAEFIRDVDFIAVKFFVSQIEQNF